MTGPFTRDDFDEVAQLVVSSWRTGLDRDWTVPPGTLTWTFAKTADHTVDVDPRADLLTGSGPQRVDP